MLYTIIVSILKLIYKIVFRYEIHNKPIDQGGGIIISSNHSSYNDPVLLAIAFDRQIHFMAKAELFAIPVFGSLIRKVNAFPISRKSNDIKALKNSMKILKENKVLGVFPEGTRIEKPSLEKMNYGLGSLAEKTNSRILPVYIDWDKKLFSKINIYFKDYIDPSNYLEKDKELDKEITSDLFYSIYEQRIRKNEDYNSIK